MNLTEDDVLLLAHIAGGFNYNRVGVPYSDRFAASVSWANADALNVLVQKVTAPPVTPPSAITVVDLAWGDGSRKAYSPFSAISMRVVVPAEPTTYAVSGYATIYEYGGDASPRILSVSLTPGDFRDPDPTGQNGPLALTSGVQASLLWNVGPGTDVALKPGGTYYFNYKNYQPGNFPCGIETRFPHA